MSQKEKHFIAIGSEVLNGQLVHLTATCGKSLTDVSGIDYKRATEFLFSLIHERKNRSGVVFVTYAFSRDNEFIFSTMPNNLKDKLFISHKVKHEINELEFELEAIEDDYYKFPMDSDEFQLADFEKHVNTHALNELTDVEFDKYHLKLANGKFLTITKGGKSITIYDIYGFFKPASLRETVYKFLKTNQPLLDRSQFDPLDFFDGDSDIEKLKSHAAFETNLAAKLATKLNDELQSNGINLSRFHGASAIASNLLSRAKARKQYHNYRFKRQLPVDMHTALRQATFGGRAEQLKIGTLHNVTVYDINSAYAAAATKLPVMLSKPKAVKEWCNEPFSFWECEYDFTDLQQSPYFGLLPNRELSGFTKYKLRGRGYFWQPEVLFVLSNFPQSLQVSRGYILNAERAPFTQEIENLYQLRLDLQEQKKPLEKVIKLAASSIYGKFCQHNGKGHYYNLFYASYITSVVRAQILDATKGFEKETICFQTDAIHSTKELPIPLSSSLGEWKLSKYDKITYLDNGVYQCYRSGKAIKTKTRGFRRFDFAGCLRELKEKRSYTELQEFFIGHNLFTQSQVKHGGQYLSDHAQKQTTFPTETDRFAMRIFDNKDVDLTQGFLDSRPIGDYNGIASAPYQIGGNRVVDMNLDTLDAMRV